MDKQQIFDLAKKASAGDNEAFEKLIEEKSQHILYNAYDILNNHHDAEDAAQDIVVKMYLHIGRLREPENFNAWLQRIIHNVCISQLRKSKYYKNDLDFETIMDTTFSESLIEKDREFLPHAFLEDRSLSHTLLETIKELPKRRRRAVILYYYEDLSQKEIAEVMGISESSVASNISRAKNDIKNKLENKTGMDIDSEIKSQGAKVAAIPVLGQVLNLDASIQFGPESAANLANFDYKNMADSTPKSSGSSNLGVKIAAAITSVGLAGGGLFIGLSEPADKPDNAPPTEHKVEQPVSEPAIESTFTESGEIIFSGGDCDCGHENPNSVSLDYNDMEVAGEPGYKWELLDEKGLVVADGEGISFMIPGDMALGDYTAKFIISDEGGNALILERDFVIK